MVIYWYSVAQILREINFGETRSSKTAVLAILGALKMIILLYFNLQKVPKFIKRQFRASKCVKMADFALLPSPKLISRKISKIEKLWNFHTVNYHQLQAPLVLDFALPIRLLSTYLFRYLFSNGFKIMKIKTCHIQGRDKVSRFIKHVIFKNWSDAKERMHFRRCIEQLRNLCRKRRTNCHFHEIPKK